LLSPAARTPKCDRRSGNNGEIPSGIGCSVADICAAGWHVCDSLEEVVDLAEDCRPALPASFAMRVFYVTRQRAEDDECSNNNNEGLDNLHGCGNFGSIEDPSCRPFLYTLHQPDCFANPPWECDDPSSLSFEGEMAVVVKRGSERGGALCCKD
jgi:hypothetical protein